MPCNKVVYRRKKKQERLALCIAADGHGTLARGPVPGAKLNKDTVPALVPSFQLFGI